MVAGDVSDAAQNRHRKEQRVALLLLPSRPDRDYSARDMASGKSGFAPGKVRFEGFVGC